MTEKTTTSKRVLFDFLWEWAENKGNWAKLLLKEILESTNILTDEQREIIYKHFRKSIGLKENIEEVIYEKPSCLFTGENIQLKSLSKIKGVNRLCSDSVIEFSPNLTVIYGENGTGKSGFSRILKDIGFSYEGETNLLPNIYNDKNEEMSAEIYYLCDTKCLPYTWKPKEKNNNLKNISVYNSSCVPISISENRNLIVTPLGFHLFDFVSKELDKLAILLNKERADYIIYYEWFSNFHDGTDYYNLIQSLANLSQEDLNGIQKFTEIDEKSLNKLIDEEKNLSVELIDIELKDLNKQNNELKDIKNLLEENQSCFSQNEWEELKKAYEKIKELEHKGLGSLSDLAKEKKIKLFGQTEFEAFIKAADIYLKTMKDDKYLESKNSRCIYCNQLLSDSVTIDLLKKYNKILYDTTRQDLNTKKNEYKTYIEKFQKVNKEIILYYSSFGLDKNDKPIQPEEVILYNKSMKIMIEDIENNNFTIEKYPIGYKSIIELFNKKIEEINLIVLRKQGIRKNIDNEKIKLTSEINILKDKKLFTDKVDVIYEIIKAYEIIKKLDENISVFNTSSISTKTTQARKELIEKEFEQTFLNELSFLRKNHLKINLNFGTIKGNTNIKQNLKGNYSLSDILSEGEQKAISLAEFFAELKIDGSNSSVIFDDPVNSLDHYIIDETAKRLIVLSETRQTILFTHSILLFNSLLYQINLSQNKLLGRQFYHTKNQYDICGVILQADDEINSPKYYITQINKLINNNSKDRAEDEISAEGYGYLRSAIELTVEYEILKGTVKRYQKNVALAKFSELLGSEIDKCKIDLNNIFEKCCGFISAHSNPTEVSSTPDMRQLKTDFEAYKKIREVFAK